MNDDEGVTVTVLFACVGSIAYSAKTVTDVAPGEFAFSVVAPTIGVDGDFITLTATPTERPTNTSEFSQAATVTVT